ncbi:phosphopantetheine-binding protein [Chitinophaga nivalis]|uniref:Phosphopantetheine-binding protein n=1 Tax=Chitinophaga nivalis TaxID=2991709 RepID=A0ABT3IJT7_9BACT|nr:phosphopantetheine-binding protein [Chitinophaga nivalis]MCW3466077.1 phosphopantetheine-binding protein [Chitinophaga nivalis]MCW3484232.1 phosphopantetheine-binding protein [Chitinophaga nivalis]
MSRQLEIKAYSVQPEEIEQALLQLPGITGAAVIAGMVHGEARLVAFYAAVSCQSCLTLKGWLRKKLPEYMVPYKLIQVSAIPFTANGMADEAALYMLWEKNDGLATCARKRASILEVAIAELWKEELGVTGISAGDSFFDMGGNSLLLHRISARMKTEFGIQPDFSDFLNQTFSQFLHNCTAKILETV